MLLAVDVGGFKRKGGGAEKIVLRFVYVNGSRNSFRLQQEMGYGGKSHRDIIKLVLLLHLVKVVIDWMARDKGSPGRARCERIFDFNRK